MAGQAGARAGSDFEDDRSASDRVPSDFWPKVKRTLGRVPFTEDLVSAWYCVQDPKTPDSVKAVLVGALAYFVVPTDLIPDFVAGLGFTDDATVLTAALGAIGSAVGVGHRRSAKTWLGKLQETPESASPESDRDPSTS